jgi:tripartite-type tricarboxylate transporter receptor subunit TctC
VPQGKPLRLVVPFPPGGATDITARTLVEPLARMLEQPVIVDNRAGAGGSIGMAEVAKAAPDGLTVGVATLSTHGVNPAVYRKLPYDPLKDFAAVTEVVKAPGVLVVNASLPVRDFASSSSTSRPTRQGDLCVAGQWHHRPHVGRAVQEHHQHLHGPHPVPWCGPGPQRPVGGQVQVYFDQVASSLPHIQSGKLRALAVSWGQRLAVLPSVPTYGELTLFSNNDPSWFGLVAPAATPPARGAPHPGRRGPRAARARRARAAGRAGPVPVG